MKKIFIITLVAVSVLYLGCSKSQPSKSAKENPVMITFLMGDVKKNGTAAANGDAVSLNDSISTGADSVCDLKIGESLIRIKEKTIVSVAKFIKTEDAEQAKVSLEVGKMLCKPKKLLKSDSFTVSTPTAVAGVRGTSFSVEAGQNKATTIMVLDGKVKVAKRIKQLEKSEDKILEASPTLEKNQKIEITKKDVENTEKLVEAAMSRLNAQGKDLSAKESEAALTAAVIDEVKGDLIIQPRKIEKFSVQETVEAKKDAEEIIQIKDAPKETSMDKSSMSPDDLAKEIEMEKQELALKEQQRKEDEQKAIAEKKEQDRIAREKARRALEEKIARDRKIELGKQNADNEGKLVVTSDKVVYIVKGKIEWEGKLVQKPIHFDGKLYVASGEYVFCALNNNRIVWKVKIENSGKLEIKDNILNVETAGGVKTIDLKSGKEKF